MALTQQQRIDLGLDEPPADGMEFIPRAIDNAPLLPGGHAPVPEYRPNPKLELRVNDKATAPRLRGMVNELVAGNLQEADKALKLLMAVNPKEGLKLLVELMAFSMPQLKAMAVQLDDRSERPSSMTFAQLQQLLAQETPPS